MIRIAVIGAGYMGKTHLSIYRAMDGVRIAAIADAYEPVGRALAEECGAEYVSDIRALPEGLDAIDICMPTDLHADAIEQAVGKTGYILCEKPLCLSLQEFERIREQIERAGVRLMAAQVLRFADAYTEIRRLIDAGAIGEVRAITASRRQKTPDWSRNGWLLDDKRSGGILSDLAVHDIDYIVSLLGEPKRVFASLTQPPAVHADALMEYDRATAAVFASWGMPTGHNQGKLSSTFEAIGTEGRLYLDVNGEMTAADRSGEKTLTYPRWDGYQRELEYFVRCAQNHLPPDCVTLESIRGTLATVARLRASAANLAE